MSTSSDLKNVNPVMAILHHANLTSCSSVGCSV